MTNLDTDDTNPCQTEIKYITNAYIKSKECRILIPFSLKDFLTAYFSIKLKSNCSNICLIKPK